MNLNNWFSVLLGLCCKLLVCFTFLAYLLIHLKKKHVGSISSELSGKEVLVGVIVERKSS